MLYHEFEFYFLPVSATYVYDLFFAGEYEYTTIPHFLHLRNSPYCTRPSCATNDLLTPEFSDKCTVISDPKC